MRKVCVLYVSEGSLSYSTLEAYLYFSEIFYSLCFWTIHCQTYSVMENNLKVEFSIKE